MIAINTMEWASKMIYEILFSYAMCLVILGELYVILRLLKEFFRIVY